MPTASKTVVARLLADQVGGDVTEVHVEAGVSAVVGQHLERAVDEDVVVEVVIAEGVDREPGQQTAAVPDDEVATTSLDDVLASIDAAWP